MAFTQETLDKIKLVCPKTKAALLLDGASLVSVDPDTRLRYEVKDDIPVMLIDEAVELSSEDWGEVMSRHGRDPQTGQTV
jgi:uncharacterized protein